MRFSNLTSRSLVLYFPKGFALERLEIGARGTGEIDLRGAYGEYAYAVFVNLEGTSGEFATGESSPKIIIDG